MGIIKELMRHANISTTMDVYGVGTLTAAKRGAQTAVVNRVLGGTANEQQTTDALHPVQNG